ncbi:MAG: asparagine synthase (glutamine-hydrolyzing), partial [Bacteroidia bacterium]|nr:asparagine synthase (glutamine-hydrolyzing) [Bacteroidia bacterium]
MCGIAGYFNATAFQPEYLERMCTRLRHRGPDGEGYVYFGTGQAIPISGNDTPGYCRGNAYPWLPQNDRPGESGFFGGFAHRRLAIVDLEASGHQPMCTPDKRFWITYNGELYNYIELKEELKKKGHVFITRSDTEVILNAWLAWGVNCLERFNGMWAFAIYDTIEQKLFASRDRFGVKPFYYYHHADTLLFASEQKALLENPALNTGLNEEAVFDYFVFGQIEYQLEGFFKNIFELLPAHFLIWDKKSRKIAQHAYYQLQYQSGAHQWNLNSFNESVETTRSLLENAIRIRMRADVEVGTCLSGGLDSSAIAGMMRKVSGSEQSLQSFTAVFPGTTIDESRWASMMAKHAGLNETYVSPSLEELSTDLHDLSLCQDIPIWSTSTYAQF